MLLNINVLLDCCDDALVANKMTKNKEMALNEINKSKHSENRYKTKKNVYNERENAFKCTFLKKKKTLSEVVHVREINSNELTDRLQS